MLTLDQILLLQEKVETAVEKISSLRADVTRLTSENDALRSKCAELTKALSEKTEQISALETQHTQIEQGILNAMSQLDSVENSILSDQADSPVADSLSAQSDVKIKTQAPAPAQADNASFQSIHNIHDTDEKNSFEETINIPETEEDTQSLQDEITIPVENNSHQINEPEVSADEIQFPHRNIDPNLDIF